MEENVRFNYLVKLWLGFYLDFMKRSDSNSDLPTLPRCSENIVNFNTLRYFHSILSCNIFYFMAASLH